MALDVGIIIRVVKEQLTEWATRARNSLKGLGQDGKKAGEEISRSMEKAAASTEKLSRSVEAARAKAARSAQGKAAAAELEALAKKGQEAVEQTSEQAESAASSFLGLLRFIPGTLLTKITLIIAAAVGGFGLLRKVAFAAGEALASFSKEVEETNQALIKHQENLIFDAATAKQAASELAKFANVQKLNAKELLKLSEDERESYTERLEAAREYHTQVLRAALIEQELGKNTVETQKAAGKALKQLRDDFNEVEKAAAFAADAAKRGLTIDAAQAIEQFQKLRAEGKSTEQTLRAVAGAFDLRSTEGIRSFAQTFGELVDTGQAGARDLGDAIDQALSKFSARDLNAFTVNLKATLGESKREVAALAAINDSVLRLSLRGLGEDAEKAINGISSAAANAITSLETIIESGQVVGEALNESFKKAFSRLDTVKAVDTMRAAIIRFGEDGRLSVKQVEEQLRALDERAAELTPGVQSLAEAYKELGLKSKEALEEAEDRARTAFEVIRNSAGSIEEIKRAFLAYAKAALEAAKASGKPIDGLLRAEAAAAGLTAELGKLINENQKVTASLESLTKSHEQANKAAEAHTRAVEAEGRAAIETARAELEQARARGNTTEITRAAIAVAETESAVAAKVAAAKRDEARAALEKVTAIEREIAADQELTDAEREVLAAAQEVAKVKEQEADAAEATAKAKEAETALAGKQILAEQGVAIAIEKSLEFTRARLELTKQFGDTAGEVFDNVTKAIEDTARAENGLIQVSGAFLDRLRADASEAAGDIVRLTDALKGSEIPTDALTDAADAALKKYQALGEEALSGLRAALEDARRRTEALRESAADTVQNLRDQLDQLRGDEQAVEEREFKRQKAELEKQLQEAIKAGDQEAARDLREALKLLAEVREERRKIREDQEKADAAREKADKERADRLKAETPEPPAGEPETNRFRRPGDDRRRAFEEPSDRQPFTPREGLTIVFNVDGKDLLSDENIERRIVPIIDRSIRRRA